MRNYQPDWNSDDLEPDADPALREAVLWHELKNGDTFSEETKQRFEAWLVASPENARSFAEIDAIWQGARELPQFAALLKKKRLAKMSRRAFVAGGGVTLCAAASGLWLSNHPFADFKTAKGELRYQTLADGSQLEIAGRTAASVDFSETRRQMSLHRGEIWFDMKQAQSRPFDIAIGDARIQGDGAQFALEASNGNHVLTVGSHQTELLQGDRKLSVNAGQQVVFGKIRADIFEVDLTSELAWREGRLAYVSQPMWRIVAGLNRWSGKQIVILDDAIAQRQATLIIDINQIDNALDDLRHALPIQTFEAPGGYIFIS
ncbi:FecR family protein [Pacificibacter marinus]|uniref:Fec operon regulator FecR n=1 Tax=Pacificibacter marinus TaxID=658057 RepID=A0A1Y5REJ5_9RHOB|nr:FecR domain-containing protein [Pacificibacter marinus]SEK22086.1 FecR family protein [Pacificibacter marinus]SLN15701.1 fec operon regulator FecR [Pacificibacter marinus]